MIRRYFGLDPWAVQDDQFVELAKEAIWLREDDLNIMELAMTKVAAKVFGEE